MSIAIDSSLASQYLDNTVNASTQIENKLNRDYSGATDEELMDACKSFEAYFIEQVMKEVEKTIPKSEDQDSNMSQLTDYFKEQTMSDLADDLADRNTVGLAQTMYEQMKRNM